MILDIPFVQDKNQRELIPDLTREYGCICQYTDFAGMWEQTVDWHWHPAFEVNYIKEGEAVYRTIDREYRTVKGDAIFVNSNAMHMVKSEADKAMKEYTLKFNPEFLYGQDGTLFDSKYVRPIMDCSGLQSFRIRPDSPEKVEMITHLLRIFKLCDEEEPGYEVLMQGELWKLWLKLCESTKEIRAENPAASVPEHGKLKQMIEFVHENYMERIQVADIAEAGAVSVRECTRCFGKYLRMPPNDYLNYHRLQVASRMLTMEDKPIAEISEACGFSTISYFGRVFKTEYGCTPREYRKGKREEQ